MCRCNLVLRAKTSMAQELPKDLEGRIMELGGRLNVYEIMVIFHLI